MGDLAAIPQWYEDVVSISFLSTQREGRGTRWRHSTVRGNDVIVEVSAWYDTLGYGVPRGRRHRLSAKIKAGCDCMKSPTAPWFAGPFNMSQSGVLGRHSQRDAPQAQHNQPDPGQPA